MAKTLLITAVVVVVGALIGTVLGHVVGMVLPEGSMRTLLAGDITAGLSPATLDLRLIEITFGCLLKLNLMSVMGIIISAMLYRTLTK